jgi:hypothetical protein
VVTAVVYVGLYVGAGELRDAIGINTKSGGLIASTRSGILAGI